MNPKIRVGHPNATKLLKNETAVLVGAFANAVLAPTLNESFGAER